MRKVIGLAFGLGIAAACVAQPVPTPAEPPPGPVATTPGALRQYATIHSIGIEWDIAGDSNHNATCKVQYRAKGAADWKDALPLFRVDYAWYYSTAKAKEPKNMFAGSLMFLRPATEYDIRLELADPDGGNAAKEIAVATRPVPAMPKGGRTLYVVPGEGGGAGPEGKPPSAASFGAGPEGKPPSSASFGAGTEADPFKGVAAADAAAQPGDILRLRPGAYGDVQLNKPGAEGGRYVVWTVAGGGEAVFKSVKLNGSFIWLDGLTLKRAERKNGVTTAGQAVIGAVVTRCNIDGYHYCIILNRQCRDWHIADNVIKGSKTWPYTPNPKLDPKDDENHPLSGEGVELAESIGGHVVCYNRISHTADGVSYPGHDTDIYGNDIFNVTDDSLEPDRGWANVRMWGNRLHDFGNAALSFQPMNCGPWYFVRNQIIGTMHRDTELRSPDIFKFRVQDRFALVNNTLVFGKYADVYCDSLFNSLCRNNLFISSTGFKPIWVAMRYREKDGSLNSPTVVMPIHRPGWKTDMDYNGYDWGPDTKDWKTPVFRYDGWTPDIQKNYFVDLKSFSESVGVEKHGLRVNKADVFDQWPVPTDVGDVGPVLLLLKKDGPAIDAGSSLPNIAERFGGKAPDLGAFEFGGPLPHYGPRDAKTMKEHALYWALH